MHKVIMVAGAAAAKPILRITGAAWSAAFTSQAGVHALGRRGADALIDVKRLPQVAAR
jgi:hypothetical protein